MARNFGTQRKRRRPLARPPGRPDTVNAPFAKDLDKKGKPKFASLFKTFDQHVAEINKPSRRIFLR